MFTMYGYNTAIFSFLQFFPFSQINVFICEMRKKKKRKCIWWTNNERIELLSESNKRKINNFSKSNSFNSEIKDIWFWFDELAEAESWDFSYSGGWTISFISFFSISFIHEWERREEKCEISWNLLKCNGNKLKWNECLLKY